MTHHSHSRLRVLARGLRSTRTRAVLSLGVVLGLGTVGTLAYWTDAATLTGGTFTAGTLDIKLDGAQNNPAAFASSFALTNMKPGDSKSAIVSVQNAGSVDFTYTATGTATGTSAGNLASSLVFKVVPGGTLASNVCSGTPTFNGTLGATATGVVTANRPIAAAGSEPFCVTATMPTGTDTGQGLSTTVKFDFDAKQVGAP